MKAKMKDRARNLPALLLFALAPVSACAVDFDGYVFDDEKLAEAKAGDGPSAECIKFCDDQEQTCGFGEDIGYESEEQCLSLCSGYYTVELECRITHLGFASANPDDPEYAATHCPHTKEDGGNTCPDARPFSCDRFCLFAGLACPFGEDEDGVFPSGSACDDACAGFSVASLECRFTELGQAEDDASQCENLLPEGEACAAADN